MSNVGRTTIINIENGKHKISFDHMIRLSRALGFAISDVVKTYNEMETAYKEVGQLMENKNVTR